MPILSLYSSSKSARENVGNKGVGFRSVFASTASVEVWSHTSDRRWWGMLLMRPARLDPRPDGWTSGEAASFYCPEPLSGEPGEDKLEEEMETLIILRSVPPHQAQPIVRRRPSASSRACHSSSSNVAPGSGDGRLNIVLDDGDGDAAVKRADLPVAWQTGHAERVGLPVPQAVRDATGLGRKCRSPSSPAADPRAHRCTGLTFRQSNRPDTASTCTLIFTSIAVAGRLRFDAPTRRRTADRSARMERLASGDAAIVVGGPGPGPRCVHGRTSGALRPPCPARASICAERSSLDSSHRRNGSVGSCVMASRPIPHSPAGR